MIKNGRIAAALVPLSLLLGACREDSDDGALILPGTRDEATQADGARRDAAFLEYAENTVEVVNETQDGVVFVTNLAVNTDPMLGGGVMPQQSGTGSGFFIDDEGFILTNYHVIQGGEQVTVRLPGSRRDFPAAVVGVAPEYDLALLQARNVPGDLYEPLELGDSDAVRVGEKAVALGSPFGLEFTVTQGIVSAKNRVVPTGVNNIPQNSIQTDAAINPGNSGGPLVNSEGEVIGINTMILSPGTAGAGVGQNAGIGFAIPSNTAKGILGRLRAGEEVSVPRVGVGGLPLAVLPEAVREELGLPADGVLVQEVAPGSPAAAAGLSAGDRAVQVAGGTLFVGGDVITEIEGREVTTLQDVQTVLVTQQPGDTVNLTVVRDGEERELELTLGEAR